MGDSQRDVCSVLGNHTDAELVRDAVRAAILRGDLLPGQAISLRALADEYRLRLPALAATLSTLESEDWLTVRGATAFVAPLSSTDLAAAHRFGLSMAQSLLPRALQSLTRTNLDRIDQLLPSPESDLTDYAEGGLGQCTRALGALYEPTCTGVVRRELHRLLAHGLRYSIFAGEVLDSLRVPITLGYAAEFREVLHLLRRGRVELAVTREIELVRHCHLFARVGLEFPRHTDDDLPIATVIPLRIPGPGTPGPASGRAHPRRRGTPRRYVDVVAPPAR